MWWSVGKQITVDNRNDIGNTSKGGDDGRNMTPWHTDARQRQKDQRA
jgi:hypothetical protein